MAISWGSWVNNSTGNGMRLGYEFSQSPSSVGSGTSSVTVTVKVYVETKASVYDSTNSYSIGGSFSASGSVDISHGSGGGTTLIRTLSRTVSTSYSGAVSTSVSASLNGINAISGTASVSGSHSTARRPYSVPAAPSGVSLSLYGDGGRVKWTRRATTAAPYSSIELNFQRDGGAWQDSATLSGGATSYVTGGFARNATYRYRVRAVNSSGASAWAYSGTVKTSADTPATPTGANVTRNSDTSHTVRWSNSNPGSSTAPYQKIQIQRWTITSGTWATIATLSGAPSSYTDKSTVSNQQYRYRVRAHNSGGASGWAQTDYVSTTPAPPGTPKATKNSAGDIKLTWSLAGVNKNTGIEVWLTEGGVDEPSRHILLPENTTSWTHASPDATKTWQYRLKAQSGADSNDAAPNLYSDFSGRSNTVQLLTNPLAPTNLTPASVVRDGTEEIPLTWQHNPVDGTDQTGYEVQVRAQGTTEWTSLVDMGSGIERRTLPAGMFENGQVIEWRVRTWGLYPDPSPFSNTASFPLSTPPSATILIPEDGQIWTAAQTGVAWEFFDPEGDQQSQWRATLIDSNGDTVETKSGSGSTTGLFAFDATLADASDYTIRVELRDSTGLWSAPVEVTITVEYPLPAKPIVTAEWILDSGAAIVSIENPVFDPATETGTIHNELWRSIDGAEWKKIADRIPTDTTITDYIPALGTVNYYRAVAVSDLPSIQESEPAMMDTSDHHWWVWVNAGSAFTDAIRIRDNADLQVASGRAKQLHQFAGRRLPVEYVGEQRNRQISLSARFAPESSRPVEVEDLSDRPAPACIRTPDGQRYFVSLGDPSISYRGVTAELSWSFTEIDYKEGGAS